MNSEFLRSIPKAATAAENLKFSDVFAKFPLASFITFSISLFSLPFGSAGIQSIVFQHLGINFFDIVKMGCIKYYFDTLTDRERITCL